MSRDTTLKSHSTPKKVMSLFEFSSISSPQNAKLKKLLKVKLYLKSETNFFSLLVFTGSQGSKNWRRARHHHTSFLMETKNQKHISFLFPFRVWFFTSQGDGSSMWFSFLGFSCTLIKAPSQVKLDAQLQLMLEMCSLTEEGNGKRPFNKNQRF